MHRFAQAVAGPVQNVGAVAGVAQDRRGGAVDFPAAQLAAGPGGVLHDADRGVARARGGGEGLAESLRNAAARISHPGDVSKDRARTIELAPEVQQHQLVAADRAMGRRRREVVRIARVFGRGHARDRVTHQAFFGEPPGHELLDLVLVGPAAVAHPPRDLVEGAVLHAIEFFRCGAVRRHRRRIPHRREPLDQIAR